MLSAYFLSFYLKLITSASVLSLQPSHSSHSSKTLNLPYPPLIPFKVILKPHSHYHSHYHSPSTQNILSPARIQKNLSKTLNLKASMAPPRQGKEEIG